MEPLTRPTSPSDGQSARSIRLVSALRAVGRLAVISLCGCAVASAPIKDATHIVATPITGEVSVAAQPSDTVGDVQPVYVSIANGTDTPRSVVPSQVFAIDNAGNRVAPLPAGEAARQAGNAGELKAALVSGATSSVVGAGIGAGLGAIAGSLIHSGATGAALGAAVGGGEAGLQGVTSGIAKSDQQADQQIVALGLQPEQVRRNFTVSGYVFFPKGEYQQIQLVLVDGESGDTQVISKPWQ